MFVVSQEVLAVYLQQFPDSAIALNLNACNHFRLYNGKAAEVWSLFNINSFYCKHPWVGLRYAVYINKFDLIWFTAGPVRHANICLSFSLLLVILKFKLLTMIGHREDT